MKYTLPLAIVTVLFFSTCGNPVENASGDEHSGYSPTTGIEFDRETFEKERQLWGEWRDMYLPNYSFVVVERRSFPVGGSEITVKNGKWHSVDYRALFQDGYARSYQTMDDVFVLIEQMVSAYTEAVRSGEAGGALIRASYDIIYHYPRSVPFLLDSPGAFNGILITDTAPGPRYFLLFRP
jgi:hypothetical protein